MSWCHSRRQSSNYSQCQAKTRCEDAAKQVGSPKRQKLKIKSQHRKEKWQLPRPKMERTSNAQSPTALVRALERTTRAVCVCVFFSTHLFCGKVSAHCNTGSVGSHVERLGENAEHAAAQKLRWHLQTKFCQWWQRQAWIVHRLCKHPVM